MKHEIRDAKTSRLLGTLELSGPIELGKAFHMPLRLAVADARTFSVVVFTAQKFAPWFPIFTDALRNAADDGDTEARAFMAAELQRYRAAQYLALAYDGDHELLKRVRGFIPLQL